MSASATPAHNNETLIALASALVDGVLTPTEQAQADADPRVQALATHLFAASQHLRRDVAINPDLREKHLAAAIAAFVPTAIGHTSTPPPASETTGDVVSLEVARARRPKYLAPALSIAAAVAVLGLVIGSLRTRHSTRDSNSSPAKVPAERVVSGQSITSDAPVNPRAPITEVAKQESDTRPLTPSAIAASDIAATEVPNTDANRGATGPPVYIVTTTAELSSLAKRVVDSYKANTTPIFVNPCAAIAGVAAANIVWVSTPALLVLSPSIEHPTTAQVVDPSACTIEASVALGS